MKITHLRLTNYRCFESFEMDFNEQLTVIVGGNGAGKTAILESLTVGFSPYLRQFDKSKTKKFVDTDALRKKPPENGFVMEPQFPIQLDAIGNWESPRPIKSGDKTQNARHRSESELFQMTHNMDSDSLYELIKQRNWGENCYFWRCQLNRPKAGTVSAHAFELTHYGRDMQDAVRQMKPIILPLLGYYGTGRLWRQLKLGELDKHLLSDSRTAGYGDCLSSFSSYKEFAYWFKQLSNAITNALDLASQGIENHHGERLRELRSAVVEAVNICLEKSGWANIYYDAAEDQIQVKRTTGGVMPVAQLSDGVRSVLALAADIAFRCCKLNGHLGAEAVKQTNGIVMIDELDLHLHPAWQQKIVPAFRKAFPQIQFILTTHSPHLLSTVPSESIRILDDGKVYSAPAGIQGAESQRILNDIFGVESRPQDDPNTKLLNQYLKHVYADQWAVPEAIQLREQLDQIYQGNEPALFQADLHIENRKWEMESDEEDSEEP